MQPCAQNSSVHFAFREAQTAASSGGTLLKYFWDFGFKALVRNSEIYATHGRRFGRTHARWSVRQKKIVRSPAGPAQLKYRPKLRPENPPGKKQNIVFRILESRGMEMARSTGDLQRQAPERTRMAD